MALSRSDRKKARTAAILDEAMAMIAEGGLDGLTIPALCKRLGISVGGLYRYFDSKEALYLALQLRAIDAYRAAWRAALADLVPAADKAGHQDDTDHLFRICAGFSFYLRDARRDPIRHRLMDAFLSAPAPVLDDDGARAVDEKLAGILADHAALLDAAARRGALSPGDALVRTHILWGALHGLDHFRKRDRILPPRLQVPALLPETFAALLRGFGAKAAPLQAALAQIPSLSPRP